MFGIDDFLIAGGIGAIAKSIFGYAGGQMDDSDRAARFRQYVQEQEELRTKEMREGIANLSLNYGGQMQRARGSASRRALATGGAVTAESLMVPIESNVASTSSQNIREFAAATNRAYDERISRAQGEFANRPIPPNVADLVGAGFGAASDMAFGQAGMNAEDKRTQALLSALLGSGGGGERSTFGGSGGGSSASDPFRQQMNKQLYGNIFKGGSDPFSFSSRSEFPNIGDSSLHF
jgi:hypothetical protein